MHIQFSPYKHACKPPYRVVTILEKRKLHEIKSKIILNILISKIFKVLTETKIQLHVSKIQNIKKKNTNTRSPILFLNPFMCTISMKSPKLVTLHNRNLKGNRG